MDGYTKRLESAIKSIVARIERAKIKDFHASALCSSILDDCDLALQEELSVEPEKPSDSVSV